MIKIIFFYFSAIALTLSLPLCQQVYAQDGNSQFFDMLDGRFDASRYLSENAYGFLPVPIIITDPAVDGGLGLVGLFFHETEEEKEKRLKAMQSAEGNAFQHLLPPSVSAGFGVMTGNDSWVAGGGHLGFFNQGKIRYKGGGGYGDVNLDFFGSGDINFDSPVEVNTKATAVIQTIGFQVADSAFFLGVSQRYVNAEVSPVSLGDFGSNLPPDLTDKIKETLTQQITTSALGLNLEFDTRDNMFSPTQGYQYFLEYLLYRDFIGSDIDYELSKFRGLNYWKPAQQWRAALRLETEYARTDDLLPPFAVPMINLRGIPAMRYQGKFVGVAETEITWEVDSRWNVLGFTGVGRASDKPSEFSDATSRVTKGAGFRYLVARRYGFETGLDFAWGPEDMVWYITAGTAWGR